VHVHVLQTSVRTRVLAVQVLAHCVSGAFSYEKARKIARDNADGLADLKVLPTTALLHYCTHYTALLYCTTLLYYTTVLHYCVLLYYCTILHCTALYCTVLHCTVLHYIELLQYCNTLRCIVLHYALLCFATVMCCVTVPLLCTHLSLLHYTALHCAG
jgi:hypothetical protein